MLVLTRKLNQEIVIGENIKITVLKVKGNTVRLGIEAPPEIRIVRSELPQATEAHKATQSVKAFRTEEKADDKNLRTSQAESPNAQITVVFNDVVDRKKERTLPIPQRKDLSSKSRTVRYQDRAPAILTHSRLQQIANKLQEKRNRPR